jgi:hypothetical protein
MCPFHCYARTYPDKMTSHNSQHLCLSSPRCKFRINIRWKLLLLPTVATRSKAWTVFVRLNNGIVGSNSTQGMDVCVCLLYVYVVLCVGSDLATGWSPVQGVLPTAYSITKLKKEASAQQRAVEPLLNEGMNEKHLLEWCILVFRGSSTSSFQ